MMSSMLAAQAQTYISAHYTTYDPSRQEGRSSNRKTFQKCSNILGIIGAENSYEQRVASCPWAATDLVASMTSSRAYQHTTTPVARPCKPLLLFRVHLFLAANGAHLSLPCCLLPFPRASGGAGSSRRLWQRRWLPAPVRVSGSTYVTGRRCHKSHSFSRGPRTAGGHPHRSTNNTPRRGPSSLACCCVPGCRCFSCSSWSCCCAVVVDDALRVRRRQLWLPQGGTDGGTRAVSPAQRTTSVMSQSTLLPIGL